MSGFLLISSLRLKDNQRSGQNLLRTAQRFSTEAAGRQYLRPVGNAGASSSLQAYAAARPCCQKSLQTPSNGESSSPVYASAAAFPRRRRSSSPSLPPADRRPSVLIHQCLPVPALHCTNRFPGNQQSYQRGREGGRRGGVDLRGVDAAKHFHENV